MHKRLDLLLRSLEVEVAKVEHVLAVLLRARGALRAPIAVAPARVHIGEGVPRALGARIDIMYTADHVVNRIQHALNLTALVLGNIGLPAEPPCNLRPSPPVIEGPDHFA